MNNLAITLKKFFTNKNTVTIIGVVAILVILYFMYTRTLNKATDKVKVPVASRMIVPQTQITAEDVTFIQVASAAKPDKVLTDENKIVGKYTGVGCTIPEGSMFYQDAIVEKEELPGNWLTLLERDPETNELDKPYYFSVNVTTTFGNSIQPGDYVDFYVRTYDVKDNKLIFGRVYENAKVLSVTDNSGRDVFKSQDNIGTPSFLNFGLSKDYYALFKAIEYVTTKDFTLIVVPHGGAIKEEDLKAEVTSQAMRAYIMSETNDSYKEDEATEVTPNAEVATSNAQ